MPPEFNASPDEAEATANMLIALHEKIREEGRAGGAFCDTHQLMTLSSEYLRIRDERDDSNNRARQLANRATRITRLIRSAIPEGDQIGYGIDGMIQSLLARMVRLEIALDERGIPIPKGPKPVDEHDPEQDRE